MPQSLSINIIHIIFSTKNRQPVLDKETRKRLYPYMAQLIRDKGSECYRIGGVEDHVHLAVRLSKKATLSKTISEIKTGTSKWLKGISADLSDFSWQEGYGAFSVSPKDLDAIIEYIDRQEEHHQKITFQDEFRKFLTQYNIDEIMSGGNYPSVCQICRYRVGLSDLKMCNVNDIALRKLRAMLISKRSFGAN